MFEKDEDYRKARKESKDRITKVIKVWSAEEEIIHDEGFQKGAEFGYNKANEWHYVKDGDLPEVDNKIVLCVCSDGYIDGKKHYILKLLTRKEFPLFQPVYVWKEIILPELKESE